MSGHRPNGQKAVATADVLVIGGGIHGCSTALHCALKGLSVIVVEKHTVGRHASGVNAGGVRRLGRALPEIPLSMAAMEVWHRISDLLGDDCGFRAAPQVKVAENETDMAVLSARADTVRAHGYDHEVLLDRRQLQSLIPAVAPHCVGGLASLEDGFADPYRTTAAFSRAAQRHGARIVEGCGALGVDQSAGHFRLYTHHGPFEGAVLVNCAGAWGGEIAGWLGEPVPIEPIAPMMLVTAQLPPFCNAVVGTAGRPLSFKQMDNGTVVVGGGRRGVVDHAHAGTRLRLPELAKTAATAAEIFPIMSDAAVVRCWAGIEGRMPDDLPVIGPSGTTAGVFHAFGFSAHGFQLGPIVGATLAERIGGGSGNLPLDAFDIQRFADCTTATT